MRFVGCVSVGVFLWCRLFCSLHNSQVRRLVISGRERRKKRGKREAPARSPRCELRVRKFGLGACNFRLPRPAFYLVVRSVENRSIGESEEAWHHCARAMAVDIERTLSFSTAIWLHSKLLEGGRSPCYKCCIVRAFSCVMVRCVQAYSGGIQFSRCGDVMQVTRCGSSTPVSRARLGVAPWPRFSAQKSVFPLVFVIDRC